MTTRTISVGALKELSDAASAQVFRAIGDLDAVCNALGEFGQVNTAFHKRAATLRAVAAHALLAATAFTASATSYELLDQIAAHSWESFSEEDLSRASKAVAVKSAKRAKKAKARRAR